MSTIDDFVTEDDVAAGYFAFIDGWMAGRAAFQQVTHEDFVGMIRDFPSDATTIVAGINALGYEWLIEKGFAPMFDVAYFSESIFADWRKLHPRCEGSPEWAQVYCRPFRNECRIAEA